jgi:hypothetical protein
MRHAARTRELPDAIDSHVQAELDQGDDGAAGAHVPAG